MGDQPKTGFARTIALCVAAGVLAFIGGRYFQNVHQRSSEFSTVPDLALDAARLNKTLPEMVSEGVRLDRTSAGPGKIFNYFYTILEDDQARIMTVDPSRVRLIFLQLNERVCAMMPNYVNHGVIVKYHLRNRLGADLPSFTVDSGGCSTDQTKK